jgi:hypothetical protein
MDPPKTKKSMFHLSRDTKKAIEEQKTALKMILVMLGLTGLVSSMMHYNGNYKNILEFFTNWSRNGIPQKYQTSLIQKKLNQMLRLIVYLYRNINYTAWTAFLSAYLVHLNTKDLNKKDPSRVNKFFASISHWMNGTKAKKISLTQTKSRSASKSLTRKSR